MEGAKKSRHSGRTSDWAPPMIGPNGKQISIQYGIELKVNM
jgi:hypothetical protein